MIWLFQAKHEQYIDFTEGILHFVYVFNWEDTNSTSRYRVFRSCKQSVNEILISLCYNMTRRLHFIEIERMISRDGTIQPGL